MDISPNRNHPIVRRNGFTIIELLVVMGITTILLGLSSINLIRPQQQANVDSSAATLIADLRNTQAQAMSGKYDSAYGLYIQNDHYFIFRGTSYTPGSSTNVRIAVPNSTLSTTFPSSIIVFSKISGEVIGYSSASSRISLTSGSRTKTIDLNRYGIPTLQ